MADVDTLDVLQHLQDHEKANFLALEDLFGSPGWKLIVKMAEQNCVDALTRAAYASSWEANRFANGQRDVWSQVVQMQDTTFAQFAALALERATTKEDDEDGFV